MSTGPHSRIYPNPVAGSLHIDRESDGPARITVVDPLGRVVRSLTSQQRNVLLDVGDWPSGVYTIRIWSGSGAERVRIVRE